MRHTGALRIKRAWIDLRPCINRSVGHLQEFEVAAAGAFIASCRGSPRPQLQRRKQGARIDATEAEAVANCVLHGQPAGRLADDVDPFGGRISFLEIACWRHDLVAQCKDREYGLEPTGRAQQVACRGFRGADGNPPIAAEDGADGRQFPSVTDRRGGRMCIKMPDLRWRYPGLPDCRFHRAARSVAVFRSCRHVVGVGGRAVPDNLGQRRRAAGERVLQGLDDEDAGPFAHHEAIAGGIERARSKFRLVVETRRERSCGSKAAKANLVDAGFGTAADRHIRFARGISRAASPIAWTLAAQAVTGAPSGPLKP